ncbi:MAG: septum formation initiator family protein [Armatimonadetes bacterium]|nr:septum formation initiator family protein [Armatimonadota bacterium]
MPKASPSIFLMRTTRLRKRPKKAYRFLLILGYSFATILAVLCLWHIVSKITEPYILDSRESREKTQIEREIARIEAENRNLRSEIAYLKTKAGIEAEARKLGMVKEGEIALIVQSPSKEESERSAGENAHPNIWQRIAGEVACFFVTDSVELHPN